MVILDEFPLWAVYLGTVVVVLVAAEIGFRIGIWLQRRDPDSGKTPMTGAVVGGMLGLMAFLLAFSIGIVIGQHNGRKDMVVTEANAVGTAYLRAGFLDEPDLTRSRDLLREYVEIRLAAASDISQLEFTQTRSEEIHGELWSIIKDNVRQGYDSDIMGLYIESVNGVIDRSLMLVRHHLEMANVTQECVLLEGDDRIVCDADQVEQALVRAVSERYAWPAPDDYRHRVFAPSLGIMIIWALLSIRLKRIPFAVGFLPSAIS